MVAERKVVQRRAGGTPTQARAAGGQLVRLTRTPVFPPAEIIHRRHVEPDPATPDPGRMERLELRAGLLIRQEIARDRAERQVQQLQRAQQLSRGDQAAGKSRKAAQEGLEAVRDRGAEGKAMLARPVAVVTLLGEPEEVRRVLDGNPLAVMDLTARQMEAAEVLASTYRDARPAMEMPRGYGNGHRGGLRHLSHDEYLAAQRAWQDYRGWLDVVARRLGPRHAASVRDAVVLQEPAPAWQVRQALDTLAAHWKLP